MVECKFVTSGAGKYVNIVLIDTWWNVNNVYFKLKCAYKSFNRYMVECKLTRKIVVYLLCVVLIDTWWNVNDDA